ncbi:MAG: type II secretion system GspH family protein [Acidobacteria bacterium]|nr:type II secretion system GspH family protein [Acidobacteriota bacterium]
MKMKGEARRRTGQGIAASRSFNPAPFNRSHFRSSTGGMTIIELVIVITVLTILTLGVIPLVRNSVQRQKEQQLREALREMREAVKEFKRDTIGMTCAVAPTTGGGPPPTAYIDPRSKVVISDCKIFGVDNPDNFPPDLETLVSGVSVIPRSTVAGALAGGTKGNATDNPLLSTKKKIYLREIPVDPITGEKDWCLRSSYDPPDDGCSSNPVNVFDVRSKAEGTALNGEKYSEW